MKTRGVLKMSLYEYNKGYADGYEKAYKEMLSTVEQKVNKVRNISPIDEMYGRYATMDEYMGATGVRHVGAVGATGPAGYMP